MANRYLLSHEVGEDGKWNSHGLFSRGGAESRQVSRGNADFEVKAAASALDVGVSARDLARLRAAAGKQPVTIPLAVLTDLMGQKVPIATATDLVLQLARSGVKDSDLALFQRNVRADIDRGADPTVAATTRARGLVAPRRAVRRSRQSSVPTDVSGTIPGLFASRGIHASCRVAGVLWSSPRVAVGAAGRHPLDPGKEQIQSAELRRQTAAHARRAHELHGDVALRRRHHVHRFARRSSARRSRPARSARRSKGASCRTSSRRAR